MTDPTPTPEPAALPPLPIFDDENAPKDIQRARQLGYAAAPGPASQAWAQLTDHISGPLTDDVFRQRLHDVIESGLVDGSREPAGAQAQAAYLMEARGEGNDALWRFQAVGVLALYLHAAARAGKTIADVRDWIDQTPKTAEAGEEIRACLSGSPEAPAMLAYFEWWLTTSERNIASVNVVMDAAFEQLHQRIDERIDEGGQ